MPDPFPTIRVPDDAGQAIEAMGSKPKFWYGDPELGRCLYKQARPGTGEDWAEKAAAELGTLLGLPHARIELATWLDTRGTVSPTFVPEMGSLIHGNEVLLQIIPGYPRDKSGVRDIYRLPQHTLHAVLRVVSAKSILPPIGWTPIPGVHDAPAVFVGYLLLDAWIGNTDRHHENWGFVGRVSAGTPPSVEIHLAPTYDHASSLGRNETDARRERRLTTNDSQFSVKAYAEKARSAFYAEAGDPRPLSTFDSFFQAARQQPLAAAAWLDKLALVGPPNTQAVLDRIPSDRISPVASAFAQEILRLNRERLLSLREVLR